MEKDLDLNLNVPRVVELGIVEMREVDGGDGWTDLIWMIAEDAIELWIETSVTLINARLAHPEYYEGVPQHL